MIDRLAILGTGLIGGSLGLIWQERRPDLTVVGHDRPQVLERAAERGALDEKAADPITAVSGADLVVLAPPLASILGLMETIADDLSDGCLVTDVGSVKQAVVRDVGPFIPEGVHLVPGHPVAGTEHSGPDAGFAELFRDRWCILTPPPGTDADAVATVRALWEACGMTVEEMSAHHHDQVLAITSHLPHLIAYTIVGTATDLEDHLKQEVVKFSASGFRDFTRIAASDPVMWRDIFLDNRDAVLEILNRFSEDLGALQRAIRWGEGDKLEDWFSRTRAIRRDVIEAKQAE